MKACLALTVPNDSQVITLETRRTMQKHFRSFMGENIAGHMSSQWNEDVLYEAILSVYKLQHNSRHGGSVWEC